GPEGGGPRRAGRHRPLPRARQSPQARARSAVSNGFLWSTGGPPFARRNSRYPLLFSVDKIDEALTPPAARPFTATAAKTGQGKVPLAPLTAYQRRLRLNRSRSGLQRPGDRK